MNVYLLSRPLIDWGEFQRFCTDENLPNIVDALSGGYHGAEASVEIAGRLCYMSYGKGRKTRREFIDNLIHSGHHSVLEHANYGILITGISRSCSHEIVRHRHFSYSQLSQRYCDHTQVEPILPTAIADNPGLSELARRALKLAFDAYRDLDVAMRDLPRKEHRTAARCVLPNATPTKIVITGNCRAWREFIQKRAVPAADPEIRELALRIRDLLSLEAPLLFGDLMSQSEET